MMMLLIQGVFLVAGAVPATSLETVIDWGPEGLRLQGLAPRPQLNLSDAPAASSVSSCRECKLLEGVCAAGSAFEAMGAATSKTEHDTLQSRMHRSGAWLSTAYDPKQLIGVFWARLLGADHDGWQYGSLVHGLTWHSSVMTVVDEFEQERDALLAQQAVMKATVQLCGPEVFRDTAWAWVCLHGGGHGAFYAGFVLAMLVGDTTTQKALGDGGGYNFCRPQAVGWLPLEADGAAVQRHSDAICNSASKRTVAYICAYGAYMTFARDAVVPLSKDDPLLPRTFEEASRHPHFDRCEASAFPGPCVTQFGLQLLKLSPIPELLAAWGLGNARYPRDGALGAPTPRAVRDLCSAPRWHDASHKLDRGCAFGMAAALAMPDLWIDSLGVHHLVDRIVNDNSLIIPDFASCRDLGDQDDEEAILRAAACLRGTLTHTNYVFSENNKVRQYPGATKDACRALCATLLDEEERNLRSLYGYCTTTPACVDLRDWHNSKSAGYNDTLTDHANGLLPLFPAHLLDGLAQWASDLEKHLGDE